MTFLFDHVPDHVVEDASVAEVVEFHLSVEPQHSLEAAAVTHLQADGNITQGLPKMGLS